MDIGKRRLTNIIRRMCDGECYYTNMTPRITRAEIEAVERAVGADLQMEWFHGADRRDNPHMVYPLHSDRFKAQAQRAGFLKPESLDSQAEL